MVREAYEADRARTDIERSHHLTSTLYFSISALEAFLNEKMRVKMKTQGSSESEIVDFLRKGSINDKLKKWPKQLTGSDVPGIEENLQLLIYFNQLRGELTHPKYNHHGNYRELSQVRPFDILNSTSEYVVKYCISENMLFPYWVFGWNYLNPRSDSYAICLVNEQQFMHSVRALGYRSPIQSLDFYAELRSIDGYRRLRAYLFDQYKCEPKEPHFPYQPKLCRFWWQDEHQKSCGNVTEQAIRRSIELGGP